MGSATAASSPAAAAPAGVIDAPRLAARMADLGTEAAFEILARARAIEATGREVVHLEIGEPSFGTPRHVVEAGVSSLLRGETRYGPPQGLIELRLRIADDLRGRGVARNVEDVVVTAGSKPALFHAALALIEPGDEVLIPDPGFPIYPSIVRLAGGTPVSYGIAHTWGGFGIDVEELASRVTSRTRVLILNSPHNPTGATADVRTLERIAELALAHDLMVISDEIYGRLIYEGAGVGGGVAPSIAAVPGMADRTVVVDGFSKAWSMTGWRLGYAAAHPSIAHKLTRLGINSHTCVPTFTQRAGIAALEYENAAESVGQRVTDRRDELARRRALVVAGLRDHVGVHCAAPAGAFYLFVDLEGMAPAGMSDEGFAHAVLDRYGVALLPGSSFGARGAGFARLSFASSAESIAKAIDRLARFRSAEGTGG